MMNNVRRKKKIKKIKKKKFGGKLFLASPRFMLESITWKTAFVT